MASINDCLVQIQKLTQKNLEILKAINDSFLTDQNHLSVKIGETAYAMPSFISLENKINSLQENFENLINAPKTGEAYFNFDGDSRAIEVRSYTHTPNSIKLNTVNKFEVEQNDIFKDFLTPTPYIHFNLNNIPNDLVSVNVKKIIPKNSELINIFTSKLGENASIEQPFADLYKILSLYKEDDDYTEYDTIKRLPIRKNIGTGTYVISEIQSDTIDENLDEYLTLKLRSDVGDIYMNKLSYKLFDETIEKLLKVGDQLVTFDDSAKMEITEIRQNTNTIVVKVLNGEYLNLMGDNEEELENINDLAKIKFFSPVDFDEDKTIDILLEEDKYIFVAVAPLNDRMNVQSPWGTGLIINVDKLTNDDKGNFREYYENNVKNIGDILKEISFMTSGSLTDFSRDKFNEITSIKPTINKDYLTVVQINKHLNDSTTVKNIRSLYSQKKKYNTELTDIQTKIDDINNKLSTISFDDTSNLRTVYTAQLTEYNKTKNELMTSLIKIIDEISLAANSSDIPIENAKYHIRGFFDIESFEKSIGEKIKGVKVQYRYKNLDNTQGTANTIAEKYLFSDWNDMVSFLRPKVVNIEENGEYSFDLLGDTSNQNVPSFNQIDIPISQGETVDIRLKILYDYGYPYVELSSDWSEIVNIEFPKEFLKDVQILDIISENNSDIETNRFENIVKEQGIPEHIGDKILDQDITYYHKPENIASGFYTTERRIIPLKDKLSEISNLLTQLRDEVYGTSANSLSVSVNIGETSNNILPNQDNKIYTQEYDSFGIPEDGASPDPNGAYVIDESGVVSVVANLTLTNNSSQSLKLFPLFPGSKDVYLNDLRSTKYDVNDYVIPSYIMLDYKIDKLTYTVRKEYDKYYLLQNSLWFPVFVTEYTDAQNNKTNKIDLIVNNLINYVSDINKYGKVIDDTYGNSLYIAYSHEKEYRVVNINDDNVEINSKNITRYTDIPGKVLLYDSDFEYYFEDCLNSELNQPEFGGYFNGVKEFYVICDKNSTPIIGDYQPEEGNSMLHRALCAWRFESSELILGWVYTSEDHHSKFNTPAQITGYAIKTNIDGEIDTLVSYIGYIPIGEVGTQSQLTYLDGGVLEDKDGVFKNYGVWIYDNSTEESRLQTANQFITFRTNNAFTGQSYYDLVNNYDTNDVLSGYSNGFKGLTSNGAMMYPALSNKYGICIDSNTGYDYELVSPSSSLIIPIIFEFKLGGNGLQSIQKTMSFDLRTSLYRDPINYTFTIIAKKKSTNQDIVLSANRKYINDIKYSTVVVK